MGPCRSSTSCVTLFQVRLSNILTRHQSGCSGKIKRNCASNVNCSSKNSEKRVIVALDGMTKADALALAQELSSLVWGFKVNDLLVQEGTEIIRQLKAFGKVFADAKLHDIPNTVENSVKKLEAAGSDLITVHASGGASMLAVANKSVTQARILAVTVLTSLGEKEAKEVYGQVPLEVVKNLAGIVTRSGLSGIVCSCDELFALRSTHQSLFKVVPGIRPAWYQQKDDQNRVNTPQYAISHGANLLVIGRPISSHKDPRHAVQLIEDEIIRGGSSCV